MLYLEEYDFGLAKHLVAGVDLWLNNPEKPLEASGTSGMKAALNGVPSLSTIDGWWVEGHVEGVTGWAIGEDALTASDARKEAASLYDKLEYVIMPMFYQRPNAYAEVMRSAIALNGSFFTAQRMMEQYLVNVYKMPSGERALDVAGPDESRCLRRTRQHGAARLPEPEPAPGEVVIDIAYSGICGSDIHEYTSHQPSMRAAGVFQPVMGHEFTGTVSALGDGVTTLSPATLSSSIRADPAATASSATPASPTSAPSRSAPATASPVATPSGSPSALTRPSSSQTPPGWKKLRSLSLWCRPPLDQPRRAPARRDRLHRRRRLHRPAHAAERAHQEGRPDHPLGARVPPRAGAATRSGPRHRPRERHLYTGPPANRRPRRRPLG